MLVLTEAATADAVRLDDACRSRRDEGGGSSPISFIRADTRGVFASVFTDFGDSFVVDDVDGEEPATGIGESCWFVFSRSLALCQKVERGPEEKKLEKKKEKKNSKRKKRKKLEKKKDAC